MEGEELSKNEHRLPIYRQPDKKIGDKVRYRFEGHYSSDTNTPPYSDKDKTRAALFEAMGQKLGDLNMVYGTVTFTLVELDGKRLRLDVEI